MRNRLKRHTRRPAEMSEEDQRIIKSVDDAFYRSYNRQSPPSLIDQIDVEKIMIALGHFIPIEPSSSPSVIKKISDEGEIMEVDIVQVGFYTHMKKCIKEAVMFAESLPGFLTLCENDQKCLINGAMVELLHIKVNFSKFFRNIF